MNKVPTPHISANQGELADLVLMPGDPLRAKYIAENFLTDTKCFNHTRNMLGYTGKYKNKLISVMGSGMGMPSMGIYSYELFNFYNVGTIIRIGSAGALNPKININDIIVVLGASTDSNYIGQYNLNGTFCPTGTYELIKSAEFSAKKLGFDVTVGNVLTSDTFYNENLESIEKWGKLGILAVEMETAALYINAARHNKKALSILTISDSIFNDNQLSSIERETGFSNMIKIVLDMNI